MVRRTALSMLAALAIVVMGATAAPPHAAAASAGRPAPTLGLRTGLFTQGAAGFGQVRPKEVYNGGDPTGLVTSITWQKWGQGQATGTGRAQGKIEPARIVAFDLGTCNGHYMYAAVEWYFPQHKQVFDANQFEDVCIGAYYPLETGQYLDSQHSAHAYTITFTVTAPVLRGSVSYGRRAVFSFHGSAAVDGALTLVSNTGHTYTGRWNSLDLTLNSCRSYLTSAPSCTFYF
jgi:hypothetical protein